ncbi:25S rRNA (adenine(645)-N(1))-methyltransferase [Cytospora mali]|uniref:Ribosomal RNA-processing protein 8 n=1 Tax=Cytospora mali TaxID=578113 RepID=A0A194UPX4_CYTMA|nr:25S rRNA (adenine(645)-N(1))-methyltransferase [Valsa mali var. pyri (nom. inval.)]
MFAVKGWSVSADKLKSEAASAPANGPSAAKKSKKRKRSAAQSEDVTSSNVADMWERVIEHKGPQPQNGGKAQSQPQEKKEKADKKRQKLNSDDAPSEDKAEPKAVSPEEKEGQEPEVSGRKEEKSAKKEQKKAKKDKSKSKETDDAPDAKSAAAEPKPSSKAVAPIPAPPKLTPLQAAMREKLISARFRHLNETLYTRPSAEAFELFKESPEMFTEYHEGFRRQVDVWPENPVDSFLTEIRQRARQRDNHRKPRPGQQQQSAKGEVLPLPRNRNTSICTIADLGCGDAGLASGLQAEKKKLKLEILSFDLHSPHPLVTKADIANLPLASGSVDVAIFCLALMGTNWIDFVEEAYRILRWKGELWVAEIKSRFGSGMKKGGGVVEHSVGNRRKAGAAAGKKANKAKDEKADEKALLVEVDGVDDTRQQTDVSAFVDVLNKRGFMLQGQDQGHGAEAVDLSNKMFVKMRFVKTAPAVKGKCVLKDKEVEERAKLAGKPPMVKKPKFIDDDDKDGNEAAVLKPCVYKIR